MKKRMFEKYAVPLAFIVMLGVFFVLNLTVPVPDTITSERRAPAAFPQFTGESVVSTSFMSGFDSWADDNFAFREDFRELRAQTVFHVFFETDKDGLYIGDSGAGKFEKINEKAWRQAAAKIRRMAGSLPADMDVYYSFIPDKSVYAGRWLPGFDPDEARRIITEEMAVSGAGAGNDVGAGNDADASGDAGGGAARGLTFVDLTDALKANDFYKTDLHWSQPETLGVVSALGGAMGFEPCAANEVHEAGDFTGAYAGQIALPLAPDTLRYVSNVYIDSAEVSYLEPKSASMSPGSVYYPKALIGGGDPYDFFLGGPQPLIILESPSSEAQRTLYLFRDSFGSSLAPLFLGAYDKIVLIDLRYIDSRVLPEYVDFEPGADVLFLYSSQIMNNPASLLVAE